MLTALDDLPRHELPDAPDAYERYFFLAAAPDGSEAVSLVVNVHPHKGVIDAAFAHSDGDTHDSLFATDRLGDDLACGPIRLTLDDPMRSLRIEVEDRVDVRFDASHPAIEEERVTRRRDGRVVQDRSRYAQLGTTSDGWFAGRDHSWGIWDSAGRSHSPSFFWLIGAFDDHAVQAVTHIDTDGRRYGEYGAVVRAGAPQEARDVTRLEVEGPSHFTTARLTLGDETLELESLHALLPRAVGYGHPTWVWGTVPPELPHVLSERIDLRQEDMSERINHRALQFVRMTRPDGAVGHGVVDQYREVKCP